MARCLPARAGSASEGGRGARLPPARRAPRVRERLALLDSIRCEGTEGFPFTPIDGYFCGFSTEIAIARW